ncbi:unnamed protein product [Gadus morhua 'NCC']
MAARDYEASSPGPDLNEDLDEIKKEKKEFMQRRNVLRLWKDRRPGKATAQDLLRMRKYKTLQRWKCRKPKGKTTAQYLLRMRGYKMLQRWKCRKPKGKTTAQDLLRGLEDLEDLPVETRRLLTGPFVKLLRFVKPLPPVPRYQPLPPVPRYQPLPPVPRYQPLPRVPSYQPPPLRTIRVGVRGPALYLAFQRGSALYLAF